MGWRDFQIPVCEQKEQKEQNVTPIPEHIALIAHIAPISESNSDNFIDRLGEVEREVYQEYYDLMTCPKYKMSPDVAHKEAMRLLIRSMNILQARDAEKKFRRRGWIQIHSTEFNKDFYLCENELAKKRVPDKSLAAFTMAEIYSLRGLSREEALLLVEAKILFRGTILNGKRHQ